MAALALPRATAPAISPVLTIVDGHATTLSTDVARHFGKRHDHVLRDIENLRAQLPQEHLPNFGEASVEAEGGNGAKASYPAYRLTRDGFTLLAMGFTGKKALAFKLAYIDAFNRMESALASQHAPERITQAMTLATQAGAAVQRAVFDACMAGRDDWRHARWLLSTSPTGEPPAAPVAIDQVVLSMAELPRYVLDPGAMLTNVELSRLASACNQRLERRLTH